MDDEYAISLAMTDLRDAYNKGDVDGVTAVFSENLIYLPDAYPSFYGSEAKQVMGARLRQRFAESDAKILITIADIAISGNFANEWGWYALTLTPRAGGEPVSTRYRYNQFWAKEADGKWRITIFINNKDVPPAMPPE